MMIRLKDGGWVNSDMIGLIETVSTGPDLGQDMVELRSIGGKHAYVAAEPAFRIAERVNETIIKAEPGYALLMPADKRSEEFSFYREVIIAWRIGEHTRPVIVDDVPTHCQYCPAILQPDGTVCEPGLCSYATVTDWEAAARKDWAEGRA